MGIGGALFGDQSLATGRTNRRAEYAPLEFNQKQRLTMAWIYELPFGKGSATSRVRPGLAAWW